MKMEGESSPLKRNLTEWRFSQYPKYILLPIDENHDQIRSNIKNVVFSEVTPRPLERNIRLVCASQDALNNILDMDPDMANREEFAEFIAGRKLPRGERWQIQLKGSGQTPYARVHDGRAVLRSAIREMIACEACHFLGIPSTRAAGLVVSDEAIVRDVYYNGCPRRERAAVVLRLSPNWFRFGSLEILSRTGEIAVLRQLSDFIIKEYFPDIQLSDENRFIRMFSEIAHKTLDLVAKWQGLGFTHGLLNTDNMSLLGLTMDFGPFGFVDSYDGGFVANCSDGEGRYALAKQPDVVVWNIGQLANALKPLLTSSQQVHMSHILKTLDTYCKNKILETFLMKIGLKEERWGDEQLVEKLLDMMQQTGADFTATFRQLAELEPSEMVSEIKLEEKWSLKRLSSHASWGCWLDQYRERLDKEAGVLPVNSRDCGVTAVDASSSGLFEDERRRRMMSANPVYVPRNWLLHEAIVDAEQDDYQKVRFLLEVLRNPFEVNAEAEKRGFSAQPPQWAYALKVSCSTALRTEQTVNYIAKMNPITNFKEWKFRDPPNYAELPINDNPEYNVPVAVKDAVFSKVPTEPLIGKLHLVCASDDALTDILDLDPSVAESEEFINFVAGGYLPEGGLSVSHRQFYEHSVVSAVRTLCQKGRAGGAAASYHSKGESWQPQLKGSGETPYSRMGDGRAVLRSSIREMVASEACQYLGIPTTRAAALVVSDDHKVWRDKSYTGHSRQERAAIVMRLAHAWYRIGSLEILNKRREPQLLKDLVDFIIKHHFPEIDNSSGDKYVEWFQEVSHRNLDTVAAWLGLGFTHGVLNTDNVSLLGVTLDYGPYGFMDYFSQHYVPNTSDDMGRYAYCKQPVVMVWNLCKLAEAMSPILSEQQQQQIKDFTSTLYANATAKVAIAYIRKLGIGEYKEGDQIIATDLLTMMQNKMADFTATFRQLSEVDPQHLLDKDVIETHWSLNKLIEDRDWEKWVKTYQKRLKEENISEEVRRQRMMNVNPIYVPRNWILEEAIKDAEKNEFGKVRFLLKLFKNPFEVNEEAEKLGYSSQPPSWSYGLKLSCSS
ncbi:unnamed protein product [Chrysodeixis includens]|uniref:Selenoprotein O n=1 Tax=Chrysodeixis includens TaxID=689277 RepID=A0A9N8L6S8_CHRIL|nr:unnamed protein product [Chrysodeixis includens]